MKSLNDKIDILKENIKSCANYRTTGELEAILKIIEIMEQDFDDFIKDLKEECINYSWSAYWTIREDELNKLIDKHSGMGIK